MMVYQAGELSALRDFPRTICCSTKRPRVVLNANSFDGAAGTPACHSKAAGRLNRADRVLGQFLRSCNP